MSVWHERSDVFKSQAGIIAHGCNCRGVMGSGVAAIVRRKYPDAYERYIAEYQQYGLELGDVQLVAIDDEGTQFIANCMTQDNFGTDRRQVDYEAVYNSFERLKELAYQHDISDIAMPQIGCGLAGGDWSIVEAMLHTIFPKGTGIRVTYHTID